MDIGVKLHRIKLGMVSRGALKMMKNGEESGTNL